jgi:hypothetical protein
VFYVWVWCVQSINMQLAEVDGDRLCCSFAINIGNDDAI